MDEKLKKRIVGGVVLASLGIIAIPMFSPHDEEKTLVKESIIPPEPQAVMHTSNIDLKAWSNNSDSVKNETVFDSDSEQFLSQALGMPIEEKITTDVPSGTTLPSVADKEPQQKPVAIIKPAVVPPIETKKITIKTESPARISPPVKTQPPTVLAKIGSSSAWAVQVGSFRQRENAERLRKKLKQLGYRAFVSKSRSGGKTVVRVRVGPQMEKARAKQVKNNIEKEMKIQAMLIELK
ncbi:hypothetical protein MNBD_GAMMA16-1489 [hydrothermal vent metagenome]|uniref:SPOR domain-containing protein n=1 Tax=hydrothermal vent metagenome TaxID=652676 RepID=A0A3B0Z595_9ZZZZ